MFLFLLKFVKCRLDELHCISWVCSVLEVIKRSAVTTWERKCKKNIMHLRKLKLPLLNVTDNISKTCLKIVLNSECLCFGLFVCLLAFFCWQSKKFSQENAVYKVLHQWLSSAWPQLMGHSEDALAVSFRKVEMEVPLQKCSGSGIPLCFKEEMAWMRNVE